MTAIPAGLLSSPRARTVAATLLTLVALSGCGHKDAKPAAATAPDTAHAVRTALIENRPLIGGLTAPGVLVSREEAAVNAELNGYRVARVLADIGDSVRAGQPLVELDDTLLRAQIDQATALTNQADVQARQAADQAGRVAGLDKSGALSQEAIDQRRFAAESAKAQATAQAASLKDLQTRAGKMVVRAPVSGVIFDRTVRPGDLSAIGGQPMFRLIRDNQVELEAQAPESALAGIKPGTGVDVALPDGRRIAGKVRLISPAVDPATKLGKVRVALPVMPGIRPGGYGQAVFSGSATVSLAAPETALSYDADGVFVMVVDQANRAHQVKVTTGRRAGGFVELLSGPPAGSRILLGASSFVLNGDKVNPVDAPAAPAGPAAK